MGHPANGALNFDSPSAAAAMGALGISGGLDMGLDHAGIAGFGGLGALGSEDDKLKRFDTVIDILSVSHECLFLVVTMGTNDVLVEGNRSSQRSRPRTTYAPNWSY